ncbi:hypothetical protein NQZ79_g665 [Umbelopsis isabellina]|nr:hypothetical protein NQZ79_g665 [Umbelopsis isabellina]
MPADPSHIAAYRIPFSASSNVKEWWSTVKSTIHIPKKRKSRQVVPSEFNTRRTAALKPILKKASSFSNDYDIPHMSELYYASQLSMPKLKTMPVPWLHPYPAPMGYYSMDNFHIQDSMNYPEPAYQQGLKRQTSVVWNEEVEIIPALSSSKYNRKPLDNATYMNLNQETKSAIRDELNYYKMNEMVVHEMSMSHTVFH